MDLPPLVNNAVLQHVPLCSGNALLCDPQCSCKRSRMCNTQVAAHYSIGLYTCQTGNSKQLYMRNYLLGANNASLAAYSAVCSHVAASCSDAA